MTQYDPILITLFIIYFSIIRRRDFKCRCKLCVGVWFPVCLGSVVGFMMEISRMNSILEKVKNNLI